MSRVLREVFTRHLGTVKCHYISFTKKGSAAVPPNTAGAPSCLRRHKIYSLPAYSVR